MPKDDDDLDALRRLGPLARDCFGAESGVSERSLYRAAKAGKLVTYLIAGKHFSTRHHVREMAEASTSRRREALPSTTDSVQRADAAIEALTGARK